MKDEKYVVFKRSEFDYWWGHQVKPRMTGVIDLPPPQLSDAVVIRTQDIFAGPGLSAYAAGIQTAIDLNRTFDVLDSQIDESQLENIRDYFFDRSREAFERHNKKVPD